MLYEEIKDTKCPYCNSENTTEDFGMTWHCKDCDRYFDINDLVIEPIRHKLSAVLSANYATEDNPLPCYIEIGEMDAQGLSSLELPHVTSIFETQDGVIYFNIDGLSEPMELDAMCIEDIEIIAQELSL